jgi:hypothetical protein
MICPRRCASSDCSGLKTEMENSIRIFELIVILIFLLKEVQLGGFLALLDI